MKSKIIKNLIQSKQLSAILVVNPANVFYLSKMTPSTYKIVQPLEDPDFIILITENANYILADSRQVGSFNNVSDYITLPIPYPPSPERIAKIIIGKTPENSIIGLEMSNLTASDYQRLCNGLKGRNIYDASFLLEDIRQNKKISEIKMLQKAAEITDACLQYVLENVRIGQTEKEIARIITSYFSKNADGCSFEPIVAYGENSAIPHYQSSDKVTIKNNGILLIDLGGKINGYCGDLTRTVYLGKAPKQYVDVYNIVAKAQRIGITSIKSGVPACKIDKSTRDVIKNAGYGKYFTHGTGHGLGIDIHEKPYIRNINNSRIEEGMVFSVEPGIYIPGWGGIRLEDITAVKNGRALNLTRSPKYLRELYL